MAAISGHNARHSATATQIRKHSSSLPFKVLWVCYAESCIKNQSLITPYITNYDGITYVIGM